MVDGESSFETFAKLSKTIIAVIPDKRSAIRNPVISNVFLDTGLRRYDKISGFMWFCKVLHLIQLRPLGYMGRVKN